MVPGEATLAETDAMFDKLKKTALATALAATALASASPAMAQDYRHRRHDDTGTAVAVAAGVLGLIAVAAIASDHGNKRDRRCDGDRDDPDYCYRTYNQGYYGNGYYQNGYYGGGTYQGGYYGNQGYYDQERRHRHDRDCDDDRGYHGGYYRGY